MSRRMNGVLWIDERRSWDIMFTVWLEAPMEDGGERLACEAGSQPW